MTPGPGQRCAVRQDPANPNRWFFDFDSAAPGGQGGAGVLLDPVSGMASIDGVGSNKRLPRRSTGGLVAEGLCQVGFARPSILECYNVEKSTRMILAAGGDGQGTVMGNLLEDAVRALGGNVIFWEPIPDGNWYHLRIHIAYP